MSGPPTVRRHRVAVLGAGVGALIALDLAQHGLDVVLVDERHWLLGGSSATQMARLHLGFHYCGDGSFAPSPDRSVLNTAQRCSLGALAWAHRHPELAPQPGRWWQFVTTDSMTSPDRFLRFCRDLARFQHEVADGDEVARRLFSGGTGEGADRSWAPLPPAAYAPHVAPGRVALGVETVERTVDLVALRRSLVDALRSRPGVEVRLGTTVRSVRRTAGGTFLVDAAGGDRLHADAVVDSRGHDVGRGVATPHGPGGDVQTTRLRLVATAPAPAALARVPSMFFLRGVLGNHTNLGDGTLRFVSEPLGNLRALPGATVPEAWRRLLASPDDPRAWAAGIGDALSRAAAAQAPDEVVAVERRLAAVLAAGGPGAGGETRRILAAAMTDGYAALVPALAGTRGVRVVPTVSVDPGRADVWRPDGDVHGRGWSTTMTDGYATVRPGKFTFGRLAADEAVARVLDHVAGTAPDVGPAVAASRPPSPLVSVTSP